MGGEVRPLSGVKVSETLIPLSMASEGGWEEVRPLKPKREKPQYTPLVVFLPGVVGLGKTTLAEELATWVLTTTPFSCVALDQDQFAGTRHPGGKMGAFMEALECALSDHTALILIHRNGPGSEKILSHTRFRGAGTAVVIPSELCSPGCPTPETVVSIVQCLARRGERDPRHCLSSLSLPTRVSIFRNFLRALGDVVKMLMLDPASKSIKYDYFNPPLARVGDAARQASQRWLLEVDSVTTWDDGPPTPSDTQLASCATASHPVCSHKRIDVGVEEVGQALLAVLTTPPPPPKPLGGGGGRRGGGAAPPTPPAFRYVGVFLTQDSCSLLGQTIGVEDLHVTIAHKNNSSLADFEPLMGTPALITVTHRFSAVWGGGRSVEALFVSYVLGGDGEPIEVASGMPHITLGVTPKDTRPGSALRVLQIIKDIFPEGLPEEDTERELGEGRGGVKIKVEHLYEPLELTGVVGGRV